MWQRVREQIRRRASAAAAGALDRRGAREGDDAVLVAAGDARAHPVRLLRLHRPSRVGRAAGGRGAIGGGGEGGSGSAGVRVREVL